MSIQPQSLNEQEHRAVICVCILAAFADGAQDEVERAQIERILNGFSEERLDLTSAYQDVLEGKLSLTQVATQLQAPSARALAYEMAVCVCHADGVLNDPEKQFLADLRQELKLDGTVAALHQQTAQALVEQPLTSLAPPAVTDPGREVRPGTRIGGRSVRWDCGTDSRLGVCLCYDLCTGPGRQTVLRKRSHAHHSTVEGCFRLHAGASALPAGPLLRGHEPKITTGECF